MSDLYSVLGVHRSADPETIRAAYRALARRNHPDAGGDEEVMVRINEAWHILGVPERRAAYDAELQGRETPPDEIFPHRTQRRNGEVVLDFGRFEGWTLKQIAAADDDYLAWLARTPMGRPIRTDIEKVLAERARLMESLRPVATMDRKGRRR